MFFMLRYNDFRFENPSYNAPNAPTVSASPLFGHNLTVPDNLQPAAILEPIDLLSDKSYVAPEASLSLDASNQSVLVTGDGSDTGDQFISSKIATAALYRQLQASATEMEGAAVAQACWQQRVPFVVIRSMSDKAGNNAYMDLKSFYHIAARNSANLVMNMVEMLR